MRGALGPSPPCTSEDKRPSKGKWDDGSLAGTSRLPCGAALYPRDVRRVGLPQPSRSRVNATGRLCSGGEASGESREAGGAGGAQAAFVRFWVAGRGDSWSVLAFGAKWIISGRQRVRCGRPACITNAYLWHNLQLVHRLEDYRGARIINLHRRSLTTYLCIGVTWHALTMARLTWEQTAGETVRTARSTRGDTGTRAGPNGGTEGLPPA